MAQLSGDLVRHKLSTYVFGQNVFYTQQTGSTNTELKRLARLGGPHGMLYITDEQLVGRGRLERSWHVPTGSSLLMSLLFRPGDLLKPIQTHQLTMLCTLAMADSIETHTGMRVKFKWPNDIVWEDNKKLAGVLTEAELEGEQVNWVVVGMGLNVNVDFSSYTDPEPDRPGRPGTGHRPLADTATSLSMILGQDTADLRLPLLQTYLTNVERRYEALAHELSPRAEWQRRLVGIGQEVTVSFMNEPHHYQGIITGVDENGALRLRQADGTMVTVIAGDVTLR
jgi:BirA family transcriptional regulator, biotin operon repressor / biotin---[acetyl-CoA-carboxylase] ligase